MSKPNDIESLSLEQLGTVSGGAGANSQIVSQLDSMKDTLKELQTAKDNGQSPMKMMMLMMWQRNQQQSQQPGWGGWGGWPY